MYTHTSNIEGVSNAMSVGPYDQQMHSALAYDDLSFVPKRL